MPAQFESEQMEGLFNDESEVMEIEINRADFTGILREIRTLKNVVIDSIIDGFQELDNSNFDEFGHQIDEKDEQGFYERPELNVKQELLEESAALDDSFDPFDEQSFDDALDYVPPAPKARPSRRGVGLPFRKHYPAPYEATDDCQVVLHALDDDMFKEYEASMGKLDLAKIKDQQDAWCKTYRNFCDKLRARENVPKDLGQLVKSKNCSQCTTFCTMNDDAMEEHLEVAHNVIAAKVECSECSETVREKALRRHIAKNHRVKQEPESAPKKRARSSGGGGKKAKNPCQLCIDQNLSPVFYTGSELILRRHLERVHNIARERIPCTEPGCDRLLIADRMDFHLRNFHSKGRDPHLKCKFCDYATGHLGCLKSHYMQLHPEEKDVELPKPKYSQYKAGQSKSYNQPMTEEYKKAWSNYKKSCAQTKQVTKAVAKHVCDQCGYKTTYARQLQTHISRVHLKIRPYACDLCPKTFLKKADLQSHIARKHEGIKDYICDECSYQCSTKYELKAHKVTIHGGEWNFKCSYEGCSFGAHQEKKLLKHIDSVHKKLMYWKCPHCPKHAAEKGNIVCHIRQVHRGIRRFTCNLCQYGVEKRARIITHMCLDHNITVKVVDKFLVCEQQDCVTVYSNEHDPNIKQYVDSVIKLDKPVPLNGNEGCDDMDD